MTILPLLPCARALKKELGRRFGWIFDMHCLLFGLRPVKPLPSQAINREACLAIQPFHASIQMTTQPTKSQ
jgi:hypothetical protein